MFTSASLLTSLDIFGIEGSKRKRKCRIQTVWEEVCDLRLLVNALIALLSFQKTYNCKCCLTLWLWAVVWLGQHLHCKIQLNVRFFMTISPANSADSKTAEQLIFSDFLYPYIGRNRSKYAAYVFWLSALFYNISVLFTF